LGGKLLRFSGRLLRSSERSDFLNGADADAVGLAEGAIDSTGFGNAHLGTVD
jgi:hypothetical protein